MSTIWRYLCTIYEGFCGSKTPSEEPPKIPHSDGFLTKKESKSPGPQGGLMTKEERRRLESETSGPIEQRRPLGMSAAPRIEGKSPEPPRSSPATPEDEKPPSVQVLLQMAIGKLKASQEGNQTKMRIILHQERTIRRLRLGILNSRKRLHSGASEGSSEGFVVVKRRPSNV